MISIGFDLYSVAVSMFYAIDQLQVYMSLKSESTSNHLVYHIYHELLLAARVTIKNLNSYLLV